jgi:hypothetical protein
MTHATCATRTYPQFQCDKPSAEWKQWYRPLFSTFTVEDVWTFGVVERQPLVHGCQRASCPAKYVFFHVVMFNSDFIIFLVVESRRGRRGIENSRVATEPFEL